MKNGFLITGFFVASLLKPASCQDFYHSPYSLYGPGILNDRTSSLNRSIGGAGIAIQDERNLNHANPASYASILFPITHIYEAGSYIETNSYQTGDVSESKANGGLTNLSYWFRLKRWYGSTLGLSPFSSVSYNINTKRSIAIANESSYTYEGNGNLSQLFWGNGFRITKNLSAGATVSYLFGSIKRNETIQYVPAGSGFTLESKTFSNKLNIDFGIQYQVSFISRKLILGGVYNDGFVLKGRTNVSLMDAALDTLTQYTGESVEYTLPRYAGVGLALHSKRSVLTAEVKFSQWSKASYPDKDLAFRDSWKISTGFAHYGNEDAENYLGLVGVKFGVHFQDHYLIVKKTLMNSWGATFGISLPVADGRSLVNIAYAYNRMGTLQNNLILHDTQKVLIDIALRDIWGAKRKFE